MVKCNTLRFGSLAVVGLLLALGSGCSGLPILKSKRAQIPEANSKNPVVRVISVWEPSEGQGLDGLPTRGFAGQLLFFTPGNNSPVRVNGDVRIYLFDDQGTPEERSKPIHQFDFVGDAWTVHLQNGALGPSYHLFIPYTKRHPYQCRCSLRARLTPKDGPPVFSETVQITLRGSTTEDQPKHPLTVLPAAADEPVLGATVEHRTVRPKLERAAEILAEFKQQKQAAAKAATLDNPARSTPTRTAPAKSVGVLPADQNSTQLDIKTFQLTPPDNGGSKNVE